MKWKQQGVRKTPMPLRWHIEGAVIVAMLLVLATVAWMMSWPVFWRTALTSICVGSAVWALQYLLRVPVGPVEPAVISFDRRALPHTAYLVLTLDISKSPPVAIRIDVFSSTANALATVSRREHNVDLEQLDAPTFHEAQEALLVLAPKRWPWMASLIRKDP